MPEQQQVTTQQDSATAPGSGGGGTLARDIALYTLVRLGMVVLLAALLMQVALIPGLVALAVSVVVVMPLSLLVFGRLRRRVAAGMAERAAHRQARRARLRAELRGERPDEQAANRDADEQ